MIRWFILLAPILLSLPVVEACGCGCCGCCCCTPMQPVNPPLVVKMSPVRPPCCCCGCCNGCCCGGKRRRRRSLNKECPPEFKGPNRALRLQTKE